MLGAMISGRVSKRAFPKKKKKGVSRPKANRLVEGAVLCFIGAQDKKSTTGVWQKTFGLLDQETYNE